MTEPAAGAHHRTAVVKALTLLSAFEGSRSSLSLTELAAHAGVPLSTAHRICADLVATEYLRRDPSGGYRPGRRIWRIAQNAGRELQETARLHLVELFRRTGRTCQLAIRDGGHALIIERVHGTGAASPPTRPGDRLPLHTCAVGKVLLAFEEPWIRDRYLAGTLEAATPATEVDSAALAGQLDVVQREGVATTVEEARRGVAGLAVPVLLASGQPVAAVGVLAPVADRRRMREDLPALRECAARLAEDAPRWPHARELLGALRHET